MNLSVGFMKKSWEKENQMVIPLMKNPGDFSFFEEPGNKLLTESKNYSGNGKILSFKMLYVEGEFHQENEKCPANLYVIVFKATM